MPIAPVRATWTATFKNEGGAAESPSVVKFHVEHPDGTDTEYRWGVDPEVTNPAVGTFVLVLVVPEVGTTGVRVEGSGGVTAQAESQFRTTAPRVA